MYFASSVQNADYIQITSYQKLSTSSVERIGSTYSSSGASITIGAGQLKTSSNTDGF